MYKVLDPSLSPIGLLSNKGTGKNDFWGDSISQQIAEAQDVLGSVQLSVDDYSRNIDVSGNTKSWDHAITGISFNNTAVGAQVDVGYYLLYQDPANTRYYLMQLTSVTEQVTPGGQHYKTAAGVNSAIYDLSRKIVEAKEFAVNPAKGQTLGTLKNILQYVMSGAGWNVNLEDYNFPIINYSISDVTTAQAVLQDLVSTFEIDVDAYVTLTNQGRLAKRVIEFRRAMGVDSKVTVRYGKNMTDMTREALSDSIYTKLYIRGGNDISIAPVNNGADYLVDDVANKLYNPVGANSAPVVYREGVITNSVITDADSLLAWGKKQLASLNHPRINYTITSLASTDAGLGDLIRVQDLYASNVIILSSRVIQKIISFADPTTNAFTLGEYTSLIGDNTKNYDLLRQLQQVTNTVQIVSQNLDDVKTIATSAKDVADTAIQKVADVSTDIDNKIADAKSYTDQSINSTNQRISETESEVAQATSSAAIERNSLAAAIDSASTSAANASQSLANNVNIYASEAHSMADSAAVARQVLSSSATSMANSVAAAASSLANDAYTKAKSDADGRFIGVESDIDGITQTVADVNGQVAVVKQSLDGFQSDVSDLKTADESIRTQMSGMNHDIVKNADSISEITQLANGIEEKVSNIAIGGRNYFIGSAHWLPTFVNNGNWATITKIAFDDNTDMLHITAPIGSSNNAGIYIKNIAPSVANSNWAFSMDVKGTGNFDGTIGIEGSTNTKLVQGVIPNDWKRISTFGTNPTSSSTLVIYFNTKNSALDVYIKLPKLEIGNIATDWTPAPEDTDSAIESTRTQLAGQITQEITDRKNGDTSTQTQLADLNQTVVANKTSIATLTQTANGLQTTVSNLAPGGRNLVLNSDVSIVQSSDNLFPNKQLNSLSQSMATLSGKQFVASVYVKITNVKSFASTGFNRAMVEFGFKKVDGTTFYVGAYAPAMSIGGSFEGRVTGLYDAKGIEFLDSTTVTQGIYIQGIQADYIEVSRPQIEVGNVATDWSPAPEDNANEIKSVQTQLAGQITQEVNDRKSQISTVQTQTASLIDSKVSDVKTGLESEISQTKDGIFATVGNQKIRYMRLATDGSTVNSGTYFYEVALYNAGNTNVLLNKIPTTPDNYVPPTSAALSYATDGNENSPYADLYSDPMRDKNLWITYDIGSLIYPDALKLVPYYKDGRRFNNVIVQVSADKNYWRTVFQGSLPTVAGNIQKSSIRIPLSGTSSISTWGMINDGISQEVTERNNAISSVQTQLAGQITAEVTNRQNGDSSINTQLSTLNKTVVANENGISTLTETAKSITLSVNSKIDSSAALSLFNENFQIAIKSHIGDVMTGINADTSGITILGKHLTLDGDVAVTRGFVTKALSTENATIGKTLTIGNNGSIINSYSKTGTFGGYTGDVSYSLNGKFTFDSSGISFSGSAAGPSTPTTDSGTVSQRGVPFVPTQWTASSMLTEAVVQIGATNVKGYSVKTNALSNGDSSTLNMSAFNIQLNAGGYSTYIGPDMIETKGSIQASEGFATSATSYLKNITASVVDSGPIRLNGAHTIYTTDATKLYLAGGSQNGGSGVQITDDLNVTGTTSLNTINSNGDINLGWTLRKNGTGLYPAHFQGFPGIHIFGTGAGIVFDEKNKFAYVVMNNNFYRITTGATGTGTWDN